MNRGHFTPIRARHTLRWSGPTIPLFLALSIVTASAAGSGVASSQKAETKRIRFRNSAPGVAYVESKVCATCHADIYEQFSKTDMGRSMSRVTPSLFATVPAPAAFFKPELNRHFRVFREDPNLFVSEYEPDSKGGTLFDNTQQIDYVIGAGANGIGLLIFRNGYLLEAPVSYYSSTKSWGLSPGSGYENWDAGFSRAAPIECLACHSGRPDPVPGRRRRYRDPPFHELAIGCENCHGPGQIHVQERMEVAPLSGNVDTSIVNPGKLPLWLADNICMYCHQAGEAAVLQPGKEYLDFRPGTPLDEVLAIFKVPLSKPSTSRSPLLEHYFLMTLSKCYRASEGQLACITCHDPHNQPSPEEAPAYFRKQCLTCHTEKSCTLPLETRLRKTPPDDCAGCHLPKQPAKEIQHSVALTDHRIRALEGKAYPETGFPESGPDTPGLIHLNAVPEKSATLPPVTLLKAYGQLVDKQFNEYQQQYLQLMNHLARTDPDDIYVIEALATQDLREGTPEAYQSAIRRFRRAIELGSTTVAAHQALANLLVRSGQVEEAIQLLKRAIALDPYNAGLYRSLSDLYSFSNQKAAAVATLRQAIKLFPQDSSLRDSLKEVESMSLQK